MRNESDGQDPFTGCTINRSGYSNIDRFEFKHKCWDPKEYELCLNRVKSEETLMEARSDSDVQIDRQIWVQGRKTNRMF